MTSSLALEEFANAIEREDSNKVESLILSGSIDVNARLPRRYNPPPLAFAVRRGCVEIAALLLRAVARIDDADDLSQTACHIAAGDHLGGDGAMALLLAHRPDLTLENAYRRNPLQIASQRHDGGGDASLLLLEAGAPRSDDIMCHLAAKSAGALEWLRTHGVAVRDLRDQFARTALHVAVRSGERYCDLALLDELVAGCGVDLEARDIHGNTCAHCAVLNSNAGALRRLLDAGAVVDSVGEMGTTPLLYASDYESVVLLLAAGADACARDDENKTLVDKIFSRADATTASRIVHALIAVDSAVGELVLLTQPRFAVDAGEIESARRQIGKLRLDFVRQRALQVCIALQSRELDALQMCEILVHSCGPVAPLIAFHQWWAIATTVKHFHR